MNDEIVHASKGIVVITEDHVELGMSGALVGPVRLPFGMKLVHVDGRLYLADAEDTVEGKCSGAQQLI